MISQCFSATKNVRAKTKGRQIAIKRIKSARVRKDRRIVREMLKANPYTEKLPCIIKCNNGAHELL